MRLVTTIFATLMFFAAGAAMAQNQFSPVITVDDRVITGYELSQRVQLLRVFRTPGDLDALAREQLIDDRLKQVELDRSGASLSAEGLEVAMSDFAARANLSTDQFVNLLRQNGVDRTTVEEFVRMGVQWRDYIRARFNRQARITDGEVDRAVARIGPSASGIEILLSEIIIPAPPQRAAAAQAAAERISRLTSTSAFSAEARRVSALPSRTNGGRLGWLPVANYPPQIQSLLLGLKPGEVTPPIGITNGVALFQLRAVREVPQAPPTPSSVVYATFQVPGDNAAAENVLARLDTCNDLYGEARGLPAHALVMTTAAPADIASDVAIELARLDTNEASANLVDSTSGRPLVLMVCNRQFDENGNTDRDAIRQQLRSQRFAGLADALLADLRASAVITP